MRARTMTTVTTRVGGMKLDGLRGPCPPFAICPACGTQTETPWENPLLVTAKRLGFYQGETTGGRCLCLGCEADQERKRDTVAETWPLGMPMEFRRAALSNYERRPGAEAAMTAAREFLTGQGDLYICGPVGSGKTRLACSVAGDFYRNVALSVRFERVAVLMSRLIDGMNDEARATLHDYTEPTLLVLDDVGVEKGSDYSRRTLQTIYDLRRDYGRRTIWTSNLDLNGLGEFLDDDRLPSRIAGASEVVYLGGDDQRLARRQPKPHGRKPWEA